MKKEKTTQFLRFVLTCLLLTTISMCQLQAQDTTRLHKLREVVVSASRSEQDPDSVGRSITVISNQDIKNSGANTLAEVLSRTEGIYIVGTGQNPGSVQSVFMRGANSNQTAIIIDGVRISDPSTPGNAIDLSEISLANIDHIEIVRGSQSTLYGSSAIGGVINIITKKGMTPGFHIDAAANAGVFGPNTSLFTENLLLNYTHKSGFYVNAEVFNSNMKGLQAAVDTSGPNSWSHLHPHQDGFNKTDLIGKAGYRNDKFDLFVSAKHLSQEGHIDAAAFTPDPAYTLGFTRNLYTWGATYKAIPHLNFSYLGGVTNLTRVTEDDSSIVDDQGHYSHSYNKGTYQGSTMTHEVQANYRIKGLNIVAGGGFFNEKMTDNTLTLNTAWGYSAKQSLDSLHINVNTICEFIHADLDGSLFSEGMKILAISLGARNTHHDLFGNNLTWEINPSIKLPGNGLLYAAWSTGFNAPSLYQFYSNQQDAGPGTISIGNRTLKAETSTSMEFGFKQKVSEYVSFHFSFFKTVVENSIDFVNLWTPNKPIASLSGGDFRGDTYLNIGTQTNQGFEFGLNTKLTSKLFVSANVSLINGKLDYNPANVNNTHTQGSQVQLYDNGAFMNSAVETFGLVRRPSTANINMTYTPCKKFSLSGDVRYVGPRTDVYYSYSAGPNPNLYGALAPIGMGDYTLVDLSVRYFICKGLSAGLRIENLFNEKYYEIYGYRTRGQSVYLNVRYSF
jgi:vitamin B12 transporter